ncbi:MAG: ABC transporter ATP-binding protein [Culicoidibacterales bacterium]
MKPILQVQAVEKYYGNKSQLTKALNLIDLEVTAGEFVAIMGPSGSGKTTLLNCLATIDAVTTGQIIINNQDVTNMSAKTLAKFRREQLGFIFQDLNLLDTLTAFENIALALTIQKIAAPLVQSRVREVSQQLGIGPLLDKYPYELSGGEQQRVAAARAVVTQPTLILADEPTGALDSQAARKLLELLSQLHTDLAATLIMVTHDPFTASYAQRIVFLKDGKFFTELTRGNLSRTDFFNRLMEVIRLLGGETDVR